MQGQGLVPNKEASMSKVFGSETLQRVTLAGMEILGLYGALDRSEKWAPLRGRIQEHWMTAFSTRSLASAGHFRWSAGLSFCQPGTLDMPLGS